MDGKGAKWEVREVVQIHVKEMFGTSGGINKLLTTSGRDARNRLWVSWIGDKYTDVDPATLSS
jgi:hypothetical protein